MRLQGRVAAVTGAGGGIGGAIAAAFRAEGAEVVESDLKADGLGPGGLAIDVSKPEDARRLVAETVARHGRIDILANVAGISVRHAIFDVTPEDFDRVLRINLYGSFYCLQEAARPMVEAGYGRIVNIASISGVRVGAERMAYGISKAGVVALTQQAAMELAPFGVTVNAIAPGPVDTALTRAHHTPAARANYHRMIPAARYGFPEEMADAAVFLAGEAAAYVSGVVLPVDGGYLAAGVRED